MRQACNLRKPNRVCFFFFARYRDGVRDNALFQEPGDDLATLVDFPESRDFSGDEEDADDFFNGTTEEAAATDAVIAEVASANIHYYAEHMQLADVVFAAVAMVDEESDSDDDSEDEVTEALAAMEVFEDDVHATAATTAPMARPGTSSGIRATSSTAGMDTPVASNTSTTSTKAGVHTGSKGLFKKLLAGGNVSKHSTPQMCAARTDEELTPQMDALQVCCCCSCSF